MPTPCTKTAAVKSADARALQVSQSANGTWMLVRHDADGAISVIENEFPSADAARVRAAALARQSARRPAGQFFKPVPAAPGGR